MLRVKRLSSHQITLIAICADFAVIGSAVLRAVLLELDLKQQFGEKGYVSFFSFLQILTVAFLAWNIYRTRKSTAKRNRSQNGYNLWAIISLAFIFFGIDEYYEVHESADFLIHHLLQIKETAWTDRIDSLIVLIYTLVGVAILYRAKSELKIFKPAFPLFKIALSLILAMIFFDILTDSRHFAEWLFADNAIADVVHKSLGVVEECCKILAGGMLVATFYRCWKISQMQTFNR